MTHRLPIARRMAEPGAMARLALACTLVVGCTVATTTGNGRPTGPAPIVTTVIRQASFEDADLAAQGRGLLDVVVRSTDRPTQALHEAQILILPTTRDTLRALTDQQGMARFSSLPVGVHEMLVRRIGYGVTRASIPVKPGCRTDAEAYIPISMIGLDPPPPMPGRVTITTCR